MSTLATTTTNFAYAAELSPAQEFDPNTSSGKHGPSIAVSAAIITIVALVTLTLIVLIILLSYRRRRASLDSAESRSSDKAFDLEKCMSTPTAPLPALAFKTSDKYTSGRTSHPQPRLVAHCQPLGTRHTTSFSQVPPVTATIKSGDQIRANFAKLIKSSRLDLSSAFSSIPLAPPKETSCIVQKVCSLKPPPAARLSPKPVQGPSIITRDWS
ncbi:hypothetical protein BDN71DRAFT_1509045 [Pleurotus eryngii]|uniref:Uncharacterized protein n=1 Tax=Pleurotus eryngii TaxID=5323 RepID=A0A9P5ZUI2_PLEER|nr:hypothetical protein BDN71DRAFT_1509045 [Pleurotus eryngii]